MKFKCIRTLYIKESSWHQQIEVNAGDVIKHISHVYGTNHLYEHQSGVRFILNTTTLQMYFRDLTLKFQDFLKHVPDGEGSIKEHHQFKCFLEEVREFDEAVHSGTREEMFKELADVVYTCYSIAYTQDVDLDYILRLVHENNMTKVVDGKVTLKDGKIQKPEGFIPLKLNKGHL